MTSGEFYSPDGEIIGYKELHAIKLAPNEVLVMVLPDNYTAKMLKRASTILSERLPVGTKYLVVTERVRFSTIAVPPSVAGTDQKTQK